MAYLGFCSYFFSQHRCCWSVKSTTEYKMPLSTGLLIAFATLLIPFARGCLDVMLNTPQFPVKVSARSFEWPFIDFQYVTVKSGVRLPTVDVYANVSSSFQGHKSKYAFVCVAVEGKVFEQFADPAELRSRYTGTCGDGMNSKGLSVGLLWDNSKAFIPAPNPTPYGYQVFNASSRLPAINILDLPTYLLAHFSTVAQVAAFLDMGKLQITWSDSFTQLFQQVLGEARLDVHVQVHDAAGGTLTMEFFTNGSWVLHNNTAGILVNSEPVPLQIEYAEAYYQYLQRNQTTFPPPYYPYLNPLDCTLVIDGCDGRFAWTYLFNKQAPRLRYNDFHLSSNFSGNGTNAALVLAQDVMSQLIPNSVLGAPDRKTVFSTVLMWLRDHTQARYYMRSYGNPGYVMLDVRSIDRRARAPVRFRDVGAVLGNGNWARNIKP
mmetsp:Transcript_35107/g.78148  ORF Transcript_35107/g.78148 Transcript_35107/m.78148 type:complete len:433 (-) Transcript_35107:942-2240(-)